VKISIRAYKDTFIWESEVEEVNLTQVILQIKGLLVLAGYHPKTVDECFTPDTFEWFPEADEVETELEKKIPVDDEVNVGWTPSVPPLDQADFTNEADAFGQYSSPE
jgi:hypothetical protein